MRRLAAFVWPGFNSSTGRRDGAAMARPCCSRSPTALNMTRRYAEDRFGTGQSNLGIGHAAPRWGRVTASIGTVTWQGPVADAAAITFALSTVIKWDQ